MLVAVGLELHKAAPRNGWSNGGERRGRSGLEEPLVPFSMVGETGKDSDTLILFFWVVLNGRCDKRKT